MTLLPGKCSICGGRGELITDDYEVGDCPYCESRGFNYIEEEVKKMANIEHPDITYALQTGYSRNQWRDIQSSEYEVERLPDGEPQYVTDYYSTAIDRKHDEYVALPIGYYLAHKNLQRYLEEKHAFEFNYEI